MKISDSKDAITIYGPFAYTPTLSIDSTGEWLLRGRREKVRLCGDSKNDMEENKIAVTKIRDYKNEDEQEKLVRERLKNLDMINPIKIYSDKIIIEFLKLMLHPTGKEIIFEDRIPDRLPVGLKLKTLQEFIEEYNKEIDTRSTAGFIHASN